jgi:hypothetical protein
MEVLLSIFGVLLVLLSLVDALWTALWVDGGAGPITRQINSNVWWVMKTLVRSKRNYWLSLAGPVTQTMVVFVWVGLLWAGWVLVYSADPNSLMYDRASEPQPSTFVDRIYFVAYAISTMGNGDFYPSRGSWQILTAFTMLSGILLITMVVSFLLSVISGVTTKQALASQITGLGSSAEEFILGVWDGQGFSGLDLQLMSMTSQLSVLTKQQLAYPILHRYHGASPKDDSMPAIAILDEALTILEYGLPKPYRPAPAILTSARATIRSYLTTLSSDSDYVADHVPPAPDLESLRRAGLPVVNEEAFMESLTELAHRRKLLLGLVEHNSFRWPQSRG